MKRHHVADADPLLGYDTLRAAQSNTPDRDKDSWSFTPNQAYAAYSRMDKVLANESEGKRLEAIAAGLADEWIPGYLNVAGWAAAEAALVQYNQSTADRIRLIDQATSYWERAMISQEQINHGAREWLQRDTTLYRLALNLAFTPLMKSMVAGEITSAAREKTFADTLAITQASIIQRTFAHKDNHRYAARDHGGFIHECSGLLTLLYMNDPHCLPLPSPVRTGMGYDHADQTHDILGINQHEGDIIEIIPIEMKGKATPDDFERYLALIVQGKVDLVAPRKSSRHTLNAFAAIYEGRQTAEDMAIIDHVISTMRSLLHLYQKGERLLPRGAKNTGKTKFYRQEKPPEGDNPYFFNQPRQIA